ncbi:lytic transglycosylase domain-containing protein [Conyzicola nivalis]|uniref:aggregation-promoting factor C-terminal-like domain-containing protein n=1 Tax=Conyzicola nivalis TaxID=1477021 RepID=UPI001E650061|nr:lytic transglycosylase domain-containing protein [Conyzicola nivalis]
MELQRREFSSSVQPVGASGAASAPRIRPAQTRSRRGLPFLAFFASMCFVLVTIIDPTAAFAITADEQNVVTNAPGEKVEPQTVAAAQGVRAHAARDAFTITKIVVPPPVVVAAKKSSGGGGAPAAGVPDPGSAKAIAYDMVIARGWGQSEFDCLVSLWNKESGWNVNAHNASSGAHGIPQALPGSKMASVGADWATNPATQITWGLGYISGRYSTPCGAWGTSQAKGWY